VRSIVAEVRTNTNNSAKLPLCSREFLGVFLGYDGGRTKADEDESEGKDGEGG
jgi:hypothetical protein